MLNLQTGSTLIKMMFAVAIIGILSTLVLHNYERQQEKVIASLARARMDNIRQQMQIYYLKTQIKVLTKTDYETFATNTIEPFQLPDNDPNYSKYFQTTIGTIGNNIYLAAETKNISKYQVGVYYIPYNNELRTCKTNNKPFSPTNWTDCK